MIFYILHLVPFLTFNHTFVWMKSHVFIFIVIIMAGSFAGIPGMILAIPAYTVIRIIAKEFLKKSRIVNKLTEKM